MRNDDTYLPVWSEGSSTEYGAELVSDIAWLYDRYASSMYRLAIFITGSADDAEDAVAEVFARLSAKRSALRAGADPRAYLLSAVRNASYGIIRGRKRRVELSESMIDYVSRAEYDGTLESRLDAAEIMKVVAMLPAQQREVVVLKALEQLTFAEVAELSGESINTVASRYRSAVQSLRKLLEGDEDE